MKPLYRPYTAFCSKQRQQDLLRVLPKEKPANYDFSTNDYLGLSQHPILIQSAITAADRLGVGSKASRLITTCQSPFLALEKAIATCKHTQAALIFSTGFQANVSVLSALFDERVLGTKPLVFSDKLNHASIHTACQLAHIKQQRYQHADYDHLQFLLEKHKYSTQPKFIVTESVFGMDGDKACLATLIRLAKQYDALLYVDEAHATGLLGHKGYGLTEDYGEEIDISMGTFSKALGGSGAYVACNRALKRYFMNRCQGFIYSTAPSLMQVAAMHAAWDLIPYLQGQVKTLFKQAQFCRSQLQHLGFDTGLSETHIIPVIFKEPAQTLAAQTFLASRGIRVSAIRPPSVAPKQSRLRIALNTNHTKEAILALLQGLIAYRQTT